MRRGQQACWSFIRGRNTTPISATSAIRVRRIGSNTAACRWASSITSPDGAPSRILVRDTWNTAIVTELAPRPGDVIISKHRYSAFFETQLDFDPKGPRDRNTYLHRGDNEHLC